MSRCLVMKFGGAAMRRIQQFKRVAAIVAAKREHFPRLAVVVSAMGDTTDRLLSMALRVNPNPPQRESDMLITTGERISSSLLAMALQRQGLAAASFTGSQAGILTSEDHTDARILAINAQRLERAFAEGSIAVIAGFQGMSRQGREITTLGRGGSDTSAVALAAALGAERVEFYKDVGGIYDRDPNQSERAQLLQRLSYSQARAIIARGAKVLHLRALDLAQSNRIALQIGDLRGPLGDRGGTWIADECATRPQRLQFESAVTEVENHWQAQRAPSTTSTGKGIGVCDRC